MPPERPRHRALAAVVAASFVLAACGSEADDSNSRSDMTDEAAKNGTGEVRTDLTPLTDRFSDGLRDPVEATWMSGTLGDRGVPGPSLFWIDAVVTVTPEVADGMRRGLDPLSDDPSTFVIDGLADVIPGGEYLGGETLDAAIGEGTWLARAAVHAELDVVVFAAVSE